MQQEEIAHINTALILHKQSYERRLSNTLVLRFSWTSANAMDVKANIIVLLSLLLWISREINSMSFHWAGIRGSKTPPPRLPLLPPPTRTRAHPHTVLDGGEGRVQWGEGVAGELQTNKQTKRSNKQTNRDYRRKKRYVDTAFQHLI